MLQIAIHGEDKFARSVIETGGERRGLAEVAAELHHEDPAVDGSNFLKQLVGAVA